MAAAQTVGDYLISELQMLGVQHVFGIIVF